MYRKGLVTGIALLFLGAGVVSGFSINLNNNFQPFGRGWLYVGGSGPGNYSTIQSAVNNASSGDTIFVYNGTYNERVNIGKSISLIGENKNSTIINAQGSDQAVEILVSTDNVLIKGFTCTNGAYGIYLNYYCDNIVVKDNILKNNLQDGIMIDEYSSVHEISDNTIMNNAGNGVSIKDSTNNVIKNNIVINNGGHGIYVYFNSDYNDISGNTIVNNSGYGLHISSSDYNNITSNIVTGNNVYGVYIGYSDYNDASGNTIANNNGHGLFFDSSSYNNIFGNNIESNSGYGLYLKLSINNSILSNTIKQNLMYGIYFAGSCSNNLVSDNEIDGHSDFGILNYYYSNNNVITENTVTNNGCGIQVYDHCNNNIISTNTITGNNLGLKINISSYTNLVYNNLFENTINCYDGCPNNVWNISKTHGKNIIGGPYIGGNYYSDYTGVDVDGDGLGETPYYIPGMGNGVDYRPLTAWDNIPPEITDVVANPPVQDHDKFVEISCSVKDNYVVEQVCVIITYPDNSIHNFTMSPSYYFNQTYSLIGKYYFVIWAVDNNGNENTTSKYSFEIINKPPEIPEKPSGKAFGRINVEHTYSSSSTEPDDDELYYWFDWGDGTNSGWLGPFSSDETVYAKHTWTTKGNYEIKVKAKDNFGAESAWSEPLTVKMIKSKTLFVNNPILTWLSERFSYAFGLLKQLMMH